MKTGVKFRLCLPDIVYYLGLSDYSIRSPANDYLVKTNTPGPKPAQTQQGINASTSGTVPCGSAVIEEVRHVR